MTDTHRTSKPCDHWFNRDGYCTRCGKDGGPMVRGETGEQRPKEPMAEVRAVRDEWCAEYTKARDTCIRYREAMHAALECAEDNDSQGAETLLRAALEMTT